MWAHWTHMFLSEQMRFILSYISTKRQYIPHICGYIVLPYCPQPKSVNHNIRKFPCSLVFEMNTIVGDEILFIANNEYESTEWQRPYFFQFGKQSFRCLYWVSNAENVISTRLYDCPGTSGTHSYEGVLMSSAALSVSLEPIQLPTL